MVFFDFFKKGKAENKVETETAKSTVGEKDKKYYQDDSYYTTVSHAGTQFEKKVITFDERKKSSFHSKRGLFVGEILLLEYVSYGTYPGPKTGYPGFWWFEYGIRDVGAMLKSLEERGYIEYASASDSVSKLTVAELKNILEKFGIPANGKKADLVAAISKQLTEEQLGTVITERKYCLTELGKTELADNAYVPYMHKEKGKTTEDDRFGPVYNVWSINKLLKGNTSNWEAVVKQEFEKREKFLNRNN